MIKKINIKFGDKLLEVNNNLSLEDFLVEQKVDTRNLVTSINSDLVLKNNRRNIILKEKDHINIFGPITGG